MNGKSQKTALTFKLMLPLSILIVSLAACGKVAERIVIRQMPQAHVQIPDRPLQRIVEGVYPLRPGTTVSHPQGKPFDVGPGGGAYINKSGLEQLRIREEEHKWWADGVEEQVGRYNNRVDENNTKAKEGMVPDEPKSGWKVWEWVTKAKSR